MEDLIASQGLLPGKGVPDATCLASADSCDRGWRNVTEDLEPPAILSGAGALPIVGTEEGMPFDPLYEPKKTLMLSIGNVESLPRTSAPGTLWKTQQQMEF